MVQTQHLFRSEEPRLGYLLALPREYAGSTAPWPVVLFLHGRGECGDNLDLVKRYGLPKLIDESEDFPCVTVSPQCPAGTDWTPHVDTLLDLLDHVVATYNADRNRVYLTGLSMGGRACWRVALSCPNRFAAIVAICGRYDADWADLHQLADIPIRIYHGAADSAVPVTESERILRGLAAIDADVDLTVYPGVGHNAWDPAYHDPALLAWLLGQRRTATKSD